VTDEPSAPPPEDDLDPVQQALLEWMLDELVPVIRERLARADDAQVDATTPPEASRERTSVEVGELTDGEFHDTATPAK
jgi:hypothetical protein